MAEGNGLTTPLLRPVDEEMEKNAAKRPKGPWRGEFVKSIVYGGLDAIVTSFCLISSISAGKLSSDVLVLGIANLVADGISMGFADYVSSSTEMAMAAEERLVMEWDAANHCSLQKLELLQCYQARGMDAHDATTVINVASKYKDLLVDIMMVARKGMLRPDEAKKPWKNGVVTFSAFIVFGSAPLLSFIVLIPFTKNDTHKFIGAYVLSGLALAVLGMAKAKIAGQKYGISTAITLVNGTIAATAAYAIGWTLRDVAGLQN